MNDPRVKHDRNGDFQVLESKIDILKTNSYKFIKTTKMIITSSKCPILITQIQSEVETHSVKIGFQP